MRIAISLFIGSIIGFFISKFPGFNYFSWDRSVNIVELFSIVFTGAIAILIAVRLESYVQNKRIEKEMYILKVSEIEKLLEEIELLLKEQKPSYKKITAMISSLRIKKRSIFKNIQNFKSINKFQTEYDGYLTDHIKILKPLLTESSAGSGLSVASDKCEYTNERISDIQQEIMDIQDKLFEFKVRINAV